MLMSAAALVAPLALITGTAHMVGPPWDAADLAVLGLPVITGVAHIFLFELIRTTGPVFFSQVGYVVTVAGVLWGMALFGERHSPWIWAALALMLAGLALVNLRRRAARLSGGSHTESPDAGSENVESQNQCVVLAFAARAIWSRRLRAAAPAARPCITIIGLRGQGTNGL